MSTIGFDKPDGSPCNVNLRDHAWDKEGGGGSKSPKTSRMSLMEAPYRLNSFENGSSHRVFE